MIAKRQWPMKKSRRYTDTIIAFRPNLTQENILGKLDRKTKSNFIRELLDIGLRSLDNSEIKKAI